MSDDRDLTIDELAQRTGTSVRTIRYYIAERLLPGPGARGAAASYGEDHVLRLNLIRRLADSGLSLAQIKARRLAELPIEEVKVLLAEDTRQTERVKLSDPDVAPGDYVAALLNRARQARRLAEDPDPGYPPALAARRSSPDLSRPTAQRPIEPDPRSTAPLIAATRSEPSASWRRFEVVDGVELHIREDVLQSEGQSILGRLKSVIGLFRRPRK